LPREKLLLSVMDDSSSSGNSVAGDN
jgi:hypothetical protein